LIFEILTAIAKYSILALLLVFICAMLQDMSLLSFLLLIFISAIARIHEIIFIEHRRRKLELIIAERIIKEIIE